MKIRIGIDVGGTFTDAVAIDNETCELIGSVKTLTTHGAEEGVAAGIVQVLRKITEEYRIEPEDVVFIAHGTTQATNALLEGDVAKVGILTLGRGIEGAKSRSDTSVGDIRLADGKFLFTENAYADTGEREKLGERIGEAIGKLKSAGCGGLVAAEAFSVDDPENELLAVSLGAKAGLPSTATNDISKLYGLKIRTRTAVINASIMPKMLEAASMTDESIRSAGIRSPLMVMRCDGGVMTVGEVKKRPILTILSGPAAGVAGALMYEKLSDGLFFEVGGTSTDISCVKDGKVMIRYAEVGGHKTYLNSLDVRTVGIGGGSMIRLENGKAADVGPRSAHIAALPYEVFTDPEKIVSPRLISVRPKEGDPGYAAVECAGGLKVALTLSGAANLAGYVKEGDYAHGNAEAAKKAWQPLADGMGISVAEAAKKVLSFAAEKNAQVAEKLMKDYRMDPRTTVFVGGGGGAASVVPYLAERMGHRHRLCKNAPVISTIGVALAMVRDNVERVIADPTDADLLRIRREAEEKAIRNGASPETVEVSVEVDAQRNIVRAVAVGATEFRSKDPGGKALSEGELIALAADSLLVPPDRPEILAGNGQLYAIGCEKTEPKLFGLIKKKTHPVRIIDCEGVIRLQRKNALVLRSTVGEWKKAVRRALDELTDYTDGGASLPDLYLLVGKRIIDLSGLAGEEQVMSLCAAELAGFSETETVIAVASGRADA